MPHTPVLESFRLDGKVALITSGAKGLGLTMATALAEAGADVALSGRTLSACEESAAKIASFRSPERTSVTLLEPDSKNAGMRVPGLKRNGAWM